MQIKVPKKIAKLFRAPRGSLRYRGAYGGRGSGKSFNFALMAAVWGATEKLKILCVREFQNSIEESFFAEIKGAIESNEWLKSQYIINNEKIRGRNGTQFFFRGLRNNPNAVKSLAGINICIVEEAETIPEYAIDTLEPSIRAPGSEIWVIWNPKRTDAPVEKFRTNPPERSMFLEMNYSDNPWFPFELEEKRQHDRQFMDPARYRWVWEGAFLVNSDSQVFANHYEVKDFEVPMWRGAPKWAGPYHGLDHGFYPDPLAGVRAWIDEELNDLYIDYEIYEQRVTIDELPAKVKAAIPDCEKYQIVADSARPELNDHMRRHGLHQVVSAQKGAGSVEAGVEFIKGFRRVFIHPRCVNVAREFDTYSHKVDRLSGQILPDLEDKNNHAIDALRYGLEPVSRGGAAAQLWARGA